MKWTVFSHSLHLSWVPMKDMVKNQKPRLLTATVDKEAPKTRRSMVCMHEVCQNGRRQSREGGGGDQRFAWSLRGKYGSTGGKVGDGNGGMWASNHETQSRVTRWREDLTFLSTRPYEVSFFKKRESYYGIEVLWWSLIILLLWIKQ